MALAVSAGLPAHVRHMHSKHISTLQFVLSFLAVVLIGKVTLGIVMDYHHYFPPDFRSDFLEGREEYFFGAYRWALYSHVVSGPCSLLLGLILISERFHRRFTWWHRRLGKAQVACILLLVAPSGLWMSFYSATGVVAGVGFGLLAITTGVCTAMGWRMAVTRRFEEHRRWMLRCYLLLCSAVILRMIGGAASIVGADPEWAYPFAAWASWVFPLAVFEVVERLGKPAR